MIRKIMHRPQAVLGLAMMLIVSPRRTHSIPSEQMSLDVASSPA